ncbi:MAG: endonuclease/exonuclease/phosphatase family protein [Myxococcota bacterium]
MIRIASFNIHGGRGRRLAPLTSTMVSMEMDVWCLQECSEQLVPWFVNALGEEWRGEHAPADYLGNAVLTRAPVTNTQPLVLESIAAEQRSAMIVTIEVRGQAIPIACVHLDHTSEETRLEQWATLIEQAESLRGGVVCGDLNALTRSDYSDRAWEEIAQVRHRSVWEPPQTRLMDIIEAQGFFDTAFSDAVRETCRFDTRVDYILIGPGCPVNVEEFEIVDGRHISDHNIVTTTLAM